MHCMAASVLLLLERLTLKELGAICKVLSVSGSWLLYTDRVRCVCMTICFWNVLGRGFHRLEGFITLSQLSS